MVEFFKKYLSPTSEERARLAVYLYAQGKGESAEEEIKEVQSPAKQAVNGSANGKSAVDHAIEIEDVYNFKAGLTASSGARPVKDLGEYEDTDAKL